MTWCHMYLQYDMVRLQLTYFVSSSFQLILTTAHWFLYNVVAKKPDISTRFVWFSHDPVHPTTYGEHLLLPYSSLRIVRFILHVLSYSFLFNGYMVLIIILWLLLRRVSSRRESSRRVISGPTLKYKMANSGVYSEVTTIRWVCYKVATWTFV
jgi:hypothetical protein